LVSADPARAWSAVADAAIVDRMLVSKAAIRDELGSRLAEFAPPGEQLQGLFVDERGQIPFADSAGTPVYVLLTTNYVLFVGIKRFSNTPTRHTGHCAASGYLLRSAGPRHLALLGQGAAAGPAGAAPPDPVQDRSEVAGRGDRTDRHRERIIARALSAAAGPMD
jgi:hypothetical protein